MPTFNLKGKDHVSTNCGGIVSLIITCVVLSYAVVKFDHLVTRYSPAFTSFLQDVPSGEKLNFQEKGFRIAFSIEDYFAPK